MIIRVLLSLTSKPRILLHSRARAPGGGPGPRHRRSPRPPAAPAAAGPRPGHAGTRRRRALTLIARAAPPCRSGSGEDRPLLPRNPAAFAGQEWTVLVAGGHFQYPPGVFGVPGPAIWGDLRPESSNIAPRPGPGARQKWIIWPFRPSDTRSPAFSGPDTLPATGEEAPSKNGPPPWRA